MTDSSTATRATSTSTSASTAAPPPNSGEEKCAVSESALRSIRDTIDGMDTKHHIEILRILVDETRDEINENSYGVHVNLSELSEATIDRIQLYIKYVKTNEKSISDVEHIKSQYKNEFFADTTDVVPAK